MTTFQSILDKYRAESTSQREKGDRFERLMRAYLLTDSKYAALFKTVWLWNDFPGRKDLGGTDTGIDLVALTHGGEYWAIQCKCYAETTPLDKAAVDSFLATSGRRFVGIDLKAATFSHRLWISTTNNWGGNALEAFKDQQPPVSRINLHNLIEAPVDWEQLESGVHGVKARAAKKELYPHVLEVCDKTVKYFKSNERGRLIMACGTGKTITSLKIAERLTGHSGNILFLVPSIALVGQTLQEWSTQADYPIRPICICSDPKISRSGADQDSLSTVDLPWPASTDPKHILKQFQQYQSKSGKGMTVVFSTYQSIDVVAQVQKVLLKNGIPQFDLIVCDEAHRTTGYTEPGMPDSAFVKVHDGGYIKSSRRLYMTATPRLYNIEVRSQAAKDDIPLWSMDDERHFGKEIHRIGFGEAVQKGLLTDYKVIILTLSDQDVPPAVQRIIANGETEIKTDDLTKLIGTVNALSKQFLGNEGLLSDAGETPMKRAVAFCQSIRNSTAIASTYNLASDNYLSSLPQSKRDQMVMIQAQHMDGTMPAPKRDQMLSWLKEPTAGNECRVITNVRVLSEGVDVPSLDAVLFLSAKNSQVDVVQSVGRVMRKLPGKNYGYIIIPVIVPYNVTPEEALNDNERYKVVWTVLNALRAHDDRFNATVNKIEHNKKRPSQIIVGGADVSFDSDGNPINKSENGQSGDIGEIGKQIAIQFEQLQEVVFARLVQKVGDRRYWEQWARDIAQIAERQIERIQYIIDTKKSKRAAFDEFILGLQKNINPGITAEQAIEMLAQHIITQPIFDALFEGYSFIKSNAVSIAMQSMLDAIDAGDNLAEQDETLRSFYASVRKRAEGIDNAQGKQRIIIELYDKFFKTAFPKMVEKLGIVYTPVEVVDFIIHSVDDILKKEFGRNLSDENIHILDPFTGTGTFMVRLLQSGRITQRDLVRKYRFELHANEIVLLAYYIAAINIENAYHDATPDPLDGVGRQEYTPFEGIVLTDTFQLGETDDSQKLFSEMFPQNSKRVQDQKKAPIRVILGNPPYSVGQKSANDNAQNQKYARLERRIADTYAANTEATNKNSLYNSYIKAFRWSADRIMENGQAGGIICFVTDAGWLDNNSHDGFRKIMQKEFSAIYVFNLRGNQRTSGELSRKEGGKIFGSGSRTPIAITLLVKNPARGKHQASIYYYDIGDYLSREEKLSIVSKYQTFTNPALRLLELQPNENGDWISHRNNSFEALIPIASETKFDLRSQSFFIVNSRGIETTRDAWVYNSSSKTLSRNIRQSIDFYNSEVHRYKAALKKNPKLSAGDFIDTDPKRISWSSSLIPQLEKGNEAIFQNSRIEGSMYRPFFKQFIYRGDKMIHRRGQFEEIFPRSDMKNVVICVSGVGVTKDFSAIITNTIPDLELIGKSQCLPLYFYEKGKKQVKSLFDTEGDGEFIQRDAISDFILDRARKQYGKNVSKEDIFYYVYGFLHNIDYRASFANDLKRTLPRLPLVEDVRDFWAFCNSGRKLADLHLNYEAVPPPPGVLVNGDDGTSHRVEKMRFPKKGQKDTIIFNAAIKITNIPAEAYEYVVNGKSAVEWIMDRYQVRTDKDSGITNDPNDWAREHGNPRYILDLLLSVINLSIQTVALVKGLPKVKFD